MISAAKNSQGASAMSLTRNITLIAAEEVPVGSSCSVKPQRTLRLTSSSSLRQDEPIPNWKRLLDLTLIFLTMPFWLSAMISPASGSLSCRQAPCFIGRSGLVIARRRFIILKFRTMHVNSETLATKVTSRSSCKPIVR